MAARPSPLVTVGVTAAIPGVARSAPASVVSPAPCAPPAGSRAATISGASKPGPNPAAMVA